jgi:hypothetical protein
MGVWASVNNYGTRDYGLVTEFNADPNVAPCPIPNP